jgi:hypothetical protein
VIEMLAGAFIMLVGIFVGWALARVKFDVGEEE